MKTVQQLLERKGHEVCSVRPDDTVFDAIKKMADEEIGSLLVMDNDKLVGIITERHYARNIILKGKSSSETPVRDTMTARVVCARPEQTIEECMAVMTEKHVRHLPVLRENKVIGVISIGDLVKSAIAEQQFIIEQLEHYIHG